MLEEKGGLLLYGSIKPHKQHCPTALGALPCGLIAHRGKDPAPRRPSQHTHTHTLLEIVYKFQENSGGILVCCEHGIVTHDGSSKDYRVPYDKYRVIAWNDSTFPIFVKLQAVRDKVLAGNFVDDKVTPRISFSKYVELTLEQ